MKKIIIAIDGLSSCGKSTMAKNLAKEISYLYVDTGAMYRAVTLYALRHNLFNHDGSVNIDALERHINHINITLHLNKSTGQPETYLNGQNVEHEIRSMEVSEHVSLIAAISAVRHALVSQQKAMGKEKGIVMDGRDIGTAVFPQAELKIFVTASPAIRAQRRYDELKSKGIQADYNTILKNIEERDYLDSHRQLSPLRKATSAIELDNSQLTMEEQQNWLLDQFNKTIHSLYRD